MLYKYLQKFRPQKSTRRRRKNEDYKRGRGHKKKRGGTLRRKLEEDEAKRRTKEAQRVRNLENKIKNKRANDEKLRANAFKKYGINTQENKWNPPEQKNEVNVEQAVTNAIEKTNNITEMDWFDMPENEVTYYDDNITTNTTQSYNDYSPKKYRGLVCAVVGHVDVGKTTLIDVLGKTNVQNTECGGITQRIRTAEVSIESIFKKIVFVDTPGHANFVSMRSRGAKVCDFAIVVISISGGIEPQTLEAIHILKMNMIPFMVVINKIDTLYKWEIGKNISDQSEVTKSEYTRKISTVLSSFVAQTHLNIKLFSENPNYGEYISAVPISARTTDGIPEFLDTLIILTELFLLKKLEVLDTSSFLVALEISSVPNLGTTIDSLMYNGNISDNQYIVVKGSEGIIVEKIKCLIKADQSRTHKLTETGFIRIVLKTNHSIIPGSFFYVSKYENTEKYISSLNTDTSEIKTETNGVCIVTSTYGIAEVIATILNINHIPLSSHYIDNISTKNVKKFILLNNPTQYKCIGLFEAHMAPDVRDLLIKNDIVIVESGTVFDLCTKIIEYVSAKQIEAERVIEENITKLVSLRILPECIYRTHNPLIIGVRVCKGTLVPGTILKVKKNEDNIIVGKVESIETNNLSINEATEGMKVAVKIVDIPGSKVFGRHYDSSDILYSLLNHRDIDYYSSCEKEYDLELYNSCLF